MKELSIGNTDVIYNLALLAVQSKQYKEAIGYYTTVIKDDDATATMYLELADVYRLSGDKHAQLRTLETARSKFKDNKVVLMNLIQELAHNNNYEAIVPIIDEAIKFEPENVELNYLAGYANETVGRIDIAKRYYQKTLQLSPNNYEANLALGLIFLGDFFEKRHQCGGAILCAKLIVKSK